MAEDNAIPAFDIAFPYAFGSPDTSADFRCSPEDFVVDEQLGFTPDGVGEHLMLQIRKRGENTAWVAEQLANFFGIKTMDVGFCGLKDRHAQTSQWFSLYLPKSDPEEDAARLAAFFAGTEAQVELLTSGRHTKKLRRGQHEANFFQITLRHVASFAGLDLRLNRILEQGVPNYFGEQRFGRNQSNLHSASRWFDRGEVIRNRNKKVMAKSAARSYLFNRVLAGRVANGSWDQIVDKDPDSTSGPLWGRGRSQVSDALAQVEMQALEGKAAWLRGLEHVGLQQERRALVLKPVGFSWEQKGGGLNLAFGLPPGAFATSVLREIAFLSNKSTGPEVSDTPSG